MKSQRNSYGKVGIVNIPYLNTGSVADISCNQKEKEVELDKALQKLSDSLDKSYQKFKMDEFFEKQMS